LQQAQAKGNAKAGVDQGKKSEEPNAESGQTAAAEKRAGGKQDDAQAANSDDDAAKRGAKEPAKPKTEQALALDQWLRQIPDDPGGLLRRKFLIEHAMKQRESIEL
jgi:Ca-activated chloride channel family protein